MLSILVEGCSTMNVPDKPVCLELNPHKAFCTYTLSDKDFYWTDSELYEGKTYFDVRNEMIRVPITTWSAHKKFFIKVCKQYNQCSDKDIAKWDKKSKSLGVKE